MKKYFISIPVLLIAILTITTLVSRGGTPPGKRVKNRFRPNYVSNEVIVSYKSPSSSRAINNLSFVSNSKSLNSSKFQLVTLDPGTDIEKAMSRIRKAPGVNAVSKNFLRRDMYTPSDSLYSTTNWPITSANIDDAWNTAETEGWLNDSVKVAVLDTGIDTDHPDLVNKLWTNAGETPANNTDDEVNGYIDDVNGANFTAISSFPDLSMSFMDILEYYWEFWIGSDYPNEYVPSIAQKIVGNGSKVSKVTLFIGRYYTPSAPLTISLRSSLDGADLATATVRPSSIPIEEDDDEEEDEEFQEEDNYGYAFLDCNLSQSVTLNNGSTYYLVATGSSKDRRKFWTVDGMWGLNLYAAGDMYLKQGSSWVPLYNSDLIFFTDAQSGNVENDDIYTGHGTHVSGIIGAEHNAGGIAGVSPGSDIMSVKVLDKSGVGSDAQIIKGIVYAAVNDAKVINMSLGGPDQSDALQSAVNYAFSQGSVIVASAGNDGYDEDNYPASCANVISVGATTANNNKIAGYSTSSSYVDVAAPGDYITSSINGGNYDSWEGTSMASPHVSGLAALLFTQNPTWTPNQVVDRIQASATDLGTSWKDDYYGYGLINGQEATGSKGSSKIYASNTKTVTYGGNASIIGNLKGGGWPPSTGLSGQNLKVWKGRSGVYTHNTTWRTSTGGAFYGLIRMPSSNTNYRLTWGGNTSYLKAYKEFTLRVRNSISIRASNRVLKHGRKIILSGTVLPLESVRNSIQIQRSHDAHNWTNITSVRISGQRYSYTFTPRKGRYYYRAYIPSHSCHYAGYSKAVKVRAY